MQWTGVAANIATAAVNSIAISSLENIDSEFGNLLITGYLLHNYVAHSRSMENLAASLRLVYNGDITPLITAVAEDLNVDYFDFSLFASLFFGAQYNYDPGEIASTFFTYTNSINRLFDD